MTRKVITEGAVRERLEKACAAIGSQRQWALQNAISPSNVNDFLKGRSVPTSSILAALGLERMTVYREVQD